MTILQRVVVAIAALGGFVVAALAASFVALTFGSSLFGWHDNPGPELGVGFIAGGFGAIVAGVFVANRLSGPAAETTR